MTQLFAGKPFDARSLKSSIFEALIDAQKKHGANTIIMEDQERLPVTYKEFILRTFALARLISKYVGDEQNIGLMLPTSLGGAYSFYSLHALGRVPVMINFTAGTANIKSACQTAQIKTVITSRRFIELGKMNDMVDAMGQYVRILYLDDMREKMTLADKLYAKTASMFPMQFAKRTKPEDTGVILFTSGSFGTPRGVVLTQANLVLNARQVAAHIKLGADWVFFNPMPMFHSLGLTGGIILPILEGLRSFQYPSPLHIKIVPELVKSTKASVLFSTDTFLNQYARQAQPDSFASLQFVVCGAEKVRDDTHVLFETQFGGVPILEGYGVTEASPVIAINRPEHNICGSVGQPIPGVELRLEPVEGISNGGKLYVKGPNVMAGYIHSERPGVLEAPDSGWHDTGDIVNIDEDGNIKILGRVKRFAKIAGEMISLTAVERMAEEVWPDNRHAVLAISDDKKGERLILITDNMQADISNLTQWAKKTGAPIIGVPKKIMTIYELPVLGSGKTDYVSLQRLAEMESKAA